MSWWLFNIQAQKELLDAELDLYKKSQSGEDTAMLKLQYTQLQIEVLFSYTTFRWRWVMFQQQELWESEL